MKKWIFLYVLNSIFLFNACITPRKVVYLNDMAPDSTYMVTQVQSLQVQKGDRLRILVQAKNPELAAPFNIETSSYQITDRGEVVSDNSGRATMVTKGYLVDEQGNIEFPILGPLHIAGKTLEEAKDLIRSKLISDKLIDQPSVKVEMLNFKISVIGEVVRQGMINVPDGHINIFEAISGSGGLTANGAANRITVIRENNGIRTSIVSNLESKEIFESPAYQLQQNDIVYVVPISGRATPKEQTTQQYTSIGVSILAIVATLIAVFK